MAVVLSFDRLPLGALGCYGNLWSETPHFDRLAAEAIVFDQHFGENFDPAAATHAWWTGCYQFPRSPEPQSLLPTLPEILRRAGVFSRLLIEKPENSPAPALPACPHFDEVEDVEGGDDSAIAEAEASCERLIARGTAWLRESAASGRAAWLLWLKARGLACWQEFGSGENHLFEDQETHGEDGSEPDEPDRNLARLDRGVGRLLEAIYEKFGNEQLLLIVTAGEGEMPAERANMPANRARLAEEIVHTPLMIRLPGAEMGSRRQCLVQTVDLAPTLLEWFDLDVRSMPVEGQSLLPTVRGEQSNGREFLYLGDDSRTVGIRTRGSYLVRTIDRSTAGETDRVHLFIKPDDLWDIHDVAAQSPDEAESLTATLDRFLSSRSRNFR